MFWMQIRFFRGFGRGRAVKSSKDKLLSKWLEVRSYAMPSASE
jgi:hypothetical protein